MQRRLLSLLPQQLGKTSGVSLLLAVAVVTSGAGFLANPALAVNQALAEATVAEPIVAEPIAAQPVEPTESQNLANPLGEPLGVCILREKLVKAGDWRTLESYWNATGHAFFQGPAGAEIKVRYGGGSIFGKDRQKQKLDGQTFKKLEIGAFSVLYARMQMKVKTDATVRYFACSGGVAKDLPKVPF